MKHSRDLLNVMQLLPTFSERELQLVRTTADHLLAKNTAAGPVYEALLAVLGIKVSYAKFQRTPAYKLYRTGETEIMHFIVERWGDLKSVELHLMLKYLLQLLIDDLRSNGAQIHLINILGQIGRIPMIFDHQFPGYKEAGLCGSILTAMSQAK